MITHHLTFIENPYTWTTLSFILIFLIGGIKTYKFICTILDKRSQKIASDLHEAQKLREEAQELLVKYQARQRKAIDESNKIRHDAIIESKNIINNAHIQLTHNLKNRERKTIERIANLENKALLEVRIHIAQIVSQATLLLISENISPKKADELLNQSLIDIKDFIK